MCPLPAAVQAIIQEQWTAYGEWEVIRELILHVLLLVMFGAYCIRLPGLLTSFSEYTAAALERKPLPRWDIPTANCTALAMLTGASLLVIR